MALHSSKLVEKLLSSVLLTLLVLFFLLIGASTILSNSVDTDDYNRTDKVREHSQDVKKMSTAALSARDTGRMESPTWHS